MQSLLSAQSTRRWADTNTAVIERGAKKERQTRLRTAFLVSRDTLFPKSTVVIGDRNLSPTTTLKGCEEREQPQHGRILEFNNHGLRMLNLPLKHPRTSSQVMETCKRFLPCKFLCQHKQRSSKEDSKRSCRRPSHWK